MKFIERFLRKPVTQTHSAEPGGEPLLMALEPRVMFDASVGIVADAAVQAADPVKDAAPADAPAKAAADTRTPQNTQRQEVVFVDGQVADINQLLAGLAGKPEVVVLDASKDGLQQMADYLKGRDGLDAIHLLSHGSDGTVLVGNVWLNSRNLSEHRDALEGIGTALKADGDLLLYGCRVGESDKGLSFVHELSRITGADVAVSSDHTGAMAQGGDWVLERSTGLIEAASLGAQGQFSGWNKLLAYKAFPTDKSYSEDDYGVDIDHYQSNGYGRDSFLLNQPGSYTISGWIDSGNNDGTDVISVDVPAGFAIQSYTLTISNVGINSSTMFRVESVTDGSARDHGLITQTVNNPLAAGQYSFYIGNGVVVLDYVLVLNVVPAISPPVIVNLNSDSVSYTEGGAYVLLDAASNATVTDADSANFNGGKLTVSVVGGGKAAEDVLLIRDQGLGASQISVSGSSVLYGSLTIGSFSGGTNGSPLVISLNGNATAAAVTALVRNLGYNNLNTAEPSTTSRSVSVVLEDGSGGTSTAAVVSVGVVVVNDAPVVNVSGTNPTYTENGSAVQLFSGATINTVETGQSVIQMTFTVTGVANGEAEKLVIDGSDVILANGTTVVTAINGTTVSVSVVSGTATITLTHGGLTSSAAQTILNTMAYRNDSESPSTANRVVSVDSVRDNGDTSNGGLNTAVVGTLSTVNVVAVNDAPTLSGGPYTFPNTNEDTSTPGVLISTLLASTSYVDPDAGALRGIAVYVTTGRGTWQYSTDNSNWTDFGNVAPTSALLLGSTTYVRYIPDGANNETVAMSFRAWDQTSGTASANGIRRLADTSTNGGSSAFSSGTAQANLSVTAVNDAPLMTPVSPTLSPLTDTSTANSGDLVSSLTGGITDVDTGAVKGIAITGLTATYGKWQFTTNAGTTWTDVGIVSNTAALILRPTDRVRFVPDGIHGETATITYKAWDQTSGTAGFQGAKVNTSTSGGTTAYSTATDTATVTVTAVNDRPVLTPSGGNVVWTEGNNVASSPVVVDSNLTLSDPDGPNPSSATVRFSSYNSGQDLLALTTDSATMGNIQASWDSTTGILTLSSAGNLATLAQFQAALRAVTYNNSSESPTTSNRDVQFQVTDGNGMASVMVSRSVTISSVNDDPVNNVPALQTAQQNIALNFNTANGNAISITDVDAGSGLMTVTLTATNGTLSLGSLSGITLVQGTGTNNASMTIEGTRANLNAALQTLSFKSGSSFLGAASVTIETNDNGNSGSGGAKTDVDTISINVIPLNPKVINVSAQGLDGTVKVGNVVQINMTWDQAVNVDTSGGIPTLLLETGLEDRNAVYVSGSGSNTLVFMYTVQAGDISADLDFQSTSALQLNGATIANVTNDLAILTLPTVGGADSLAGRSNIVVDGVVPVVESVSVPASGSYIVGQNLDFTVNFNEAVTVDASTGLPRIAVTLDTGGTVYAEYVSGSGSSALVFRMVVANGQLDSNGVALGSSIDTNGGTITDLAGNAAVTTLSGVASTAGVNVDGIVPTVVSVVAPADGSYKAGDVLTFTVNASENLQIGSLSPRLALDVGGVTRYANYVSGNGTASLVFQYVVEAGDNDSNGIAVNSLDLRGEQLTDLAGNDIDPTLDNGNLPDVRVDTTIPTVNNIVRVGSSPTNSSSASFTVTFSEDVSGVDDSDFTLVLGGTAGGSIASVTRVDGRTYTVLVDQLTGTGTLQLNLNASSTGIADAAGNALSGGLSGASYSIDRVAPSVTSVDVPASGTYVAGQNLDFTVNFNEAVTVDTTAGAPRIAITLDNGGTAYAEYVSGSGSNALVFRMLVTSGQFDGSGVSLGSAIQLNGSTIRDSVGNDLVATLNSVSSTAGVLVDAVVPQISSLTLPTDGSYKAGDVLYFTVNLSEVVTVNSSNGEPRLLLRINGVDHYAHYVSGSGSSALLFAYNIQSGQGGASQVTLGNSLDLNGATVRDAAGNDLNPILQVPGNSRVLIDTVAPQVSAIANLDASPSNAGSLAFNVMFSENVSGVDVADFGLVFSGTAGGRVASVQQIDDRTYRVLVDSLSGMGDVRLDLKATGTGIVDAAGNSITAGLQGSSYSIDRVAPSISSVDMPPAGNYRVGQNLDFTLNTNEPVVVASENGTPRLAIRLDNGQLAYANYLSGSGSNALVFRLTVSSGMSAGGTLVVEPTVDLNGGAIRDALGNDVQRSLGQIGSTADILVDAKAPLPTGIVLEKAATATDRSMSFVLSFDEVVSGVDASDFSLITTGNASGVLQAVEQIDSKTYRVLVAGLSGTGSLTLSLNAVGSGIADSQGNALQGSLNGPVQNLRDQDVGDLEYRLNPPETAGTPEAPLVAPQVPGVVMGGGASLLTIAPLFEVRSVGGDLQPLGTIFLGTGSNSPSFIAQVFGSSDSALGGGDGQGFLGFAGDAGGVFGASTLASIFGRDVPGVSEMNIFSGSQWQSVDLNQGLRGVFGAPTFGQQLHEFNEADKRHVRELAMALAQPAQIGNRA